MSTLDPNESKFSLHLHGKHSVVERKARCFWKGHQRNERCQENGRIIPEQKIAAVVKIVDGNSRASSTAIAGIISELNLINKDELESFLNKPVYNSTDQTVGSISWCG